MKATQVAFHINSNFPPVSRLSFYMTDTIYSEKPHVIEKRDNNLCFISPPDFIAISHTCALLFFLQVEDDKNRTKFTFSPE